MRFSIRVSTARIGFGGNIYARTYHPDATNQSRAAIIDLTAGGEATGIDIRVGRPMKSYTLAARVLDTATGAPVAGATCGYGPRSDSLGNVRMDGLMPGRYWIKEKLPARWLTSSCVRGSQITSSGARRHRESRSADFAD